MSLLRLIVILGLFHTSIFSWSWFSSPKPPAKVDFDCPHHCGRWGSESIQALEWQFVLCLYEADKLQNFIEKNLEAINNYHRYFSLVEAQFLLPPENFHSKWYQDMFETNRCGRLVIQNGYDCYTDWGIFWRIKHIDQTDGKHLGKVFKRKKYDEPWFNGTDEDKYDYSKREIREHENDSDWDTYIWGDLIEKNSYSFKNRIDFHNACMQIEQDMWDNLQQENFRYHLGDYEDTPLFKKEMHDRFGKFSLKLQEVRNSYDYIFEECSRLHNAPSAEYELIHKQFENGDYTEAIEALKELLDKVNLDSLESHLASNIYTSKGWAESETLQYDEAIISLSQAIALNPTNPDAYFERAIAYFETGQFDLSLQDYLTQGKDITFKPFEEEWSLSIFSTGFTKGCINGTEDSATEFLPSIYNSIAGVGNFLWLTIKHPIDTPKQLVYSIQEFCNHLRTCDKAELAKILVPEMYELIDKWDQLTYERRGELMGYSLGKYGLDILLPVATLKGLKSVKTFHDIKKAEKLCTLQTLAKSPQSKEALTQAAAQWKSQKQASLAKLPNGGITTLQEKKLFASATKAYDSNLTQIAHSLSKHAGRHPEVWGELKGSMSSWHDQALKQFDYIHNAPGAYIKVVDTKTGLAWIEKRLPDGRGIRLNRDYTFKGFVD